MNRAGFIAAIREAHAPLKGLVEMIPDDKIDWAPDANYMTIGQILAHLAENWSLIRMLDTGQWPFETQEEMADAMKLENLPSFDKAMALATMEKDLEDAVAYIEEKISEEDFAHKIVKAPWGFEGALWQGVMLTRDHLLNHKMQLFLYLKLLGLPVHTGTLYGM